MQMIDEASYQGLYWTADRLRANGIQVVAVKATEGTTYQNPYHDQQVTAARAAGCAVMHYHLSHPGNVLAELQNFNGHAKAQPGDLIMYDFEPQFWNAVPPAQCSSAVGQWAAASQGHFRAPTVIYTPGDPIATGRLESVRGRNPLFYAVPGADPNRPPAPPRPWLISFLQYTQRQGTDIDVAYFNDRAQLAKLAIPRPTPPPPPAPSRGQALAAIDQIDKAAGQAPGVHGSLGTLTRFVEVH